MKETRKTGNLFACTLRFHTLPLLPKTKGADYLFVTSALGFIFYPSLCSLCFSNNSFESFRMIHR